MRANKNINVAQVNRALETLQKIKNLVDPGAFIAGGFAAKLHLGTNWQTDIDVFFSCPNFDVDSLGRTAFPLLKNIFGNELQGTDMGMYWYNKRFCRVATMRGIDFIQVSKAPANMEKYVLEKFDINLCKITAHGYLSEYHSDFYTKPSKEFLDGLENNTLIYDLNLADYKYESEAQAKITKSRVEKYAERFRGFKVQEKGKR